MISHLKTALDDSVRNGSCILGADADDFVINPDPGLEISGFVSVSRFHTKNPEKNYMN